MEVLNSFFRDTEIKKGLWGEINMVWWWHSLRVASVARDATPERLLKQCSSFEHGCSMQQHWPHVSPGGFSWVCAAEPASIVQSEAGSTTPQGKGLQSVCQGQ